jgi:SAM-dependent methyltransferase
VASQAQAARLAGFDEVVEGFFPDALLNGTDTDQFDVITFNDVLEHILEPAETVAAAKKLLAPGGRVIAAIPNVQVATLIWDLIRGRWEYTDEGILDRTHVRFFTKSSMKSLFEDAEFRVEKIVGADPIWVHPPGSAPVRWAKKLAASRMGDARFVHFVIVAVPER